MKLARALMTHDPRYIQSGERLIDTIDLFFKSNIHFAPVITPVGEILGLLSEVSLIKASLRHYLAPEKNEKVYDHKDLLEPAHFVKETDSIDEVVRTLIKSTSKRVLVLDDKLQLTGIISPKDILRFVTGMEHQKIQMNEQLRKYQETTKTLSSQVQNLQDLVYIYKTAFENSPLMMHSVDPKGNIVMANRKIHQVLDYENGELIGRSLTDLYPHTMHELAFDGLEQIKRVGVHASTMTQMVKKDGHTYNVDVVSSALKDSQGVFLATITISRPLESSKALMDAIQNGQFE